MDPKRGYSRRAQSSSESSSSSPASPASPALGGSSRPAGGSHRPAGGSNRPAPANTFANDGSFMEMFKRKMEEEQRRKKELLEQQGRSDTNTAEEGQATQEKKPLAVTSFVGKRRGGVALKTGMVAKKQKVDEQVVGKSDAWSAYMAEVKKYKAHQCGDDDKTRPLVK